MSHPRVEIAARQRLTKYVRLGLAVSRRSTEFVADRSRREFLGERPAIGVSQRRSGRSSRNLSAVNHGRRMCHAAFAGGIDLPWRCLDVIRDGQAFFRAALARLDIERAGRRVPSCHSRRRQSDGRDVHVLRVPAHRAYRMIVLSMDRALSSGRARRAWRKTHQAVRQRGFAYELIFVMALLARGTSEVGLRRTPWRPNVTNFCADRRGNLRHLWQRHRLRQCGHLPNCLALYIPVLGSRFSGTLAHGLFLWSAFPLSFFFTLSGIPVCIERLSIPQNALSDFTKQPALRSHILGDEGALAKLGVVIVLDRKTMRLFCPAFFDVRPILRLGRT